MIGAGQVPRVVGVDAGAVGEARHSRCTRTRSAIGSMSRCSKCAPVAADLLGQPVGHLAERPGARPGAAMLIGPCRYSIAG